MLPSNIEFLDCDVSGTVKCDAYALGWTSVSHLAIPGLIRLKNVLYDPRVGFRHGVTIFDRLHSGYGWH